MGGLSPTVWTLLFLSTYHSLVTSLSIPSGVQPTQNQTASTQPHQDKALLLDPNPPTAFKVDGLFWGPEKDGFGAPEVWFGVMTSGSFAAQYPDYQRVIGVRSYVFPNSEGIMTIHDTSLTTCGVLVWTFYEMGRAMVQRYPWPHTVPPFYGSVSTYAGLAAVFRFGADPGNEGTVSKNGTNDDLVIARRRDVASAKPPLGADRGIKVCFEDKRLVLRYAFLGQPLVPGQAFTAFLRSNTFFSAYAGKRGVHMMAYSADRSVRLSLDEITGGRRHLSWEVGRLGVLTLWRMVMGFRRESMSFEGTPRWETLMFTLEYDGVAIGQGSLVW
ncbi:MAG: hypothetical protein Q9219_004771 [cf. Caloplaca sp. 3 TL-2023]